MVAFRGLALLLLGFVYFHETMVAEPTPLFSEEADSGYNFNASFGAEFCLKTSMSNN
ncbi:MAG: hypothetical protein ACI80S_000204, partial [Pseudohongiellaceae bacterium]